MQEILNEYRPDFIPAHWSERDRHFLSAFASNPDVFVWGMSQVAMKFVEDQRIGLEPIEKSTRYVNFGSKVGGRYLYYIPKPDLERLGLVSEYKTTMDGLFETYVALLPRLQDWLRKNFDEKDSILEKKAFDTLRGLLPMATLGQVAFRGNAQAFEYLINRTARHPLGELRWLSRELKRELDQEIPSLLLRVAGENSEQYQVYLHDRYRAVREFVGENASDPAPKAEVRLVEYDPQSELKILAAIIFEQTHSSWDEALEKARTLNDPGRRELFERYLLKRSARWQKVGRAFENTYLRFEIVIDIGSYRDLHRHSMMTQQRQRFSTLHGNNVPIEV